MKKGYKNKAVKSPETKANLKTFISGNKVVKAANLKEATKKLNNEDE